MEGQAVARVVSSLACSSWSGMGSQCKLSAWESPSTASNCAVDCARDDVRGDSCRGSMRAASACAQCYVFASGSRVNGSAGTIARLSLGVPMRIHEAWYK